MRLGKEMSAEEIAALSMSSASNSPARRRQRTLRTSCTTSHEEIIIMVTLAADVSGLADDRGAPSRRDRRLSSIFGEDFVLLSGTDGRHDLFL